MSNKTRKGKKQQTFNNKRRMTLKDTLQAVYHEKANLETTMACQCVCCKIAMPSLNYCEFSQIASEIWKNWDENDKAALICTSLEYFFKNEFDKWGIETLVKPCVLQDKLTGLCREYGSRPLSCRIFGLWPNDLYNERVDKFAKAYEKFGLSREDLPLFTQCPLVKRVDDKVEITKELIASLYADLDKLDKKIGNFTDLQISQKNNYRSFSDWLLLKVFGESWLVRLTTFMMSANKEQLEDQIIQLKNVVYQNIKTLTERIKD